MIMSDILKFNDFLNEETYHDRKFKREQEKKDKREKNKKYISKEEALKSKPDELTDNNLWEKCVNSYSDGAKFTLKDIISDYKKLMKNKIFTYSKYKNKNK